MAWDYKIASAQEPIDSHVVQELLDAYSSDGWELAFVTQGEGWLRLFFKILRPEAPAEVSEEQMEPEVAAIPEPPAPNLRPLTQRLIPMSDLGDLRKG